MPRTSLVLTGVILIIGALLLGGCGADESAQGETSAGTAGAIPAVDQHVNEALSEAAAGVVSDPVVEPITEAPGSADVAGELQTDGSGGAGSTHVSQDSPLAGARDDTGASTSAKSPTSYEERLDEPEHAYGDAPWAQTSPEGLSVTRAYICRGIEESEPTDAGRSFLPKEDGLNRLCCFSEIAGAARPDSIWHVWYWGERQMGRVGLEVKNARWRTWSRKQVLDEWKGEWHVDIVDAAGFILYRLEFSIE